MSIVLLPKSAGKIPVNGIELYYEAFGDRAKPAVLLIMGLGAPGLQWFPYFIEPIVNQGYYVIRYDNRDTGLSTWIQNTVWQRSPYSLETMAKDAVGLLDALKIDKAHVIGASMGGAIAQQITLSDPSRVLSLTSLISFASISALQSGTVAFPVDKKVPTLPEYLAFWESLTGSAFLFDKDLFSDLYQEHVVVRQGYNPDCNQHHLTAIALSESWTNKLKQLNIPTLVANGTEDPLVPFRHAQDYAALIPQAKLFAMDKVGHEIPEGICPKLHAEIFNLFNSI